MAPRAHPCVVCGRWGSFGVGPPGLGSLTTFLTATVWYCHDDLPSEHRPGAATTPRQARDSTASERGAGGGQLQLL